MTAKAAPEHSRTEDLHIYLTPPGLRALRRIVAEQQTREPRGILTNQSLVFDTLVRTFSEVVAALEADPTLDPVGSFGSKFTDLWRRMRP